MKNIVFIPNIKLNNSRSDSYHYSIKSWENWSKQYKDIEVIEWNDPIMDPNQFKITLQRYWVHDILHHNNIEYNQVLIVDADTIIHPSCPNFFEETNNKFSVVVNNGCYEWVTRSIREWGKCLFPNEPKVKPWKYFNGGFQITNKTHIPFYKKVQEFYTKNIDQIIELQSIIKAGTDQTIINYLTQLYQIETTYLPECYNLQDMFNKNLLHIPKHSWFPDELLYLEAGWIYHFNAIPQNPRNAEYWMERTFKTLSKIPLNIPSEYSPISKEYFLDMEIAFGGGGKEIIKQNNTLKTVRDVVKFFSKKENLKKTKQTLQPKNWQYFNCMLAEFRHGVADHHELGWENMTEEYYDSLEEMSDEEIEKFLKETPVEFDNGFIKHSYHRACSMIGRLINGKPYIPFYMKTSQIYNEPRKKDGIHRVKPLTKNIPFLKELDQMGIDRNEYCLCQSAILGIMGIRKPDDLDIIISSKLRKQNIKWPTGIEIFPQNYIKFDYFGASGDDDIIENYCIEIDGYKFLEPRFYFARKNGYSTARDQKDWNSIKQFFRYEKYKGYPFNFDYYKWGFPTGLKPTKLKDLNLSKMEIIRDKYNRIVDGINHGRIIYHDKENKRYIKIFHPEYCRLENFKIGLNSFLMNGLCPALISLVFDESKLIGYIMEEGEILSSNESDTHLIPDWFIRTVARNCKKRSKIFYDLVPSNIIKTRNGQLSLIDLESVYNLDDIESMKRHNAKIKPSNLKELISNG